jgi:hypothetical protein
MIRNLTKTLLATFQQALKEHTALAKTNMADRQEYLQHLVDVLKLQNNSQHATVKHREQTRADFSVIKKVMKPRRSKGFQ